MANAKHRKGTRGVTLVDAQRTKDPPSVWSEWHRIMRDRMMEKTRRMQDYDRDVYWPALTALRDRCASEGHSRGKYHSNGLGWSWWTCTKCGTDVDKRRDDE